jgi:hypothetical protein
LARVEGSARVDEIQRDLDRDAIIRPESSTVPCGAPGDGADDAGAAGISVDDALRLAIKLSVDARDYERAAALLELVKTRVSEPATPPAMALTRKRGGT